MKDYKAAWEELKSQLKEGQGFLNHAKLMSSLLVKDSEVLNNSSEMKVVDACLELIVNLQKEMQEIEARFSLD